MKRDSLNLLRQMRYIRSYDGISGIIVNKSEGENDKDEYKRRNSRYY